MGNKFENILVEKVREDKELMALKHQWEYIKLYIPQKLRIISQVFPHYSLHDESHSINVLNNIWRIIGEKVALKFSVTDLWLLLSTAYLHDCGMIVLKDDFENCFSKEEDFKNYIKDCQKDIYSELKVYQIKSIIFRTELIVRIISSERYLWNRLNSNGKIQLSASCLAISDSIKEVLEKYEYFFNFESDYVDKWHDNRKLDDNLHNNLFKTFVDETLEFTKINEKEDLRKFTFNHFSVCLENNFFNNHVW